MGKKIFFSQVLTSTLPLPTCKNLGLYEALNRSSADVESTFGHFLLTVCRQGPLFGPPPLYHPSRSPQHSVGQPFRILFSNFLFSNSRISRCQGCRGKIDHTHDDLVIQHKEHVLFQNPHTGGSHTGRWEMSHDLRNTYYHACVTLKHPPAELIMVKNCFSLVSLVIWICFVLSLASLYVVCVSFV